MKYKKCPEAGALKTPVRRPRNSAAREVPVREVRGVQRREAALRMRSAARGGAAAAARGRALGGAHSEPAGLRALFLSLEPHVKSSAVCPESAR